MKQGSAFLADRNAPTLQGVRDLLAELFEVAAMAPDEESLVANAECLTLGLAVIDMSLPVAKVNVLKMVHRRCPGQKVVVLSAHDEPVAVERVLSLGAAAFVLNRAAATDLIPTITEVLAGRMYVSPAARPVSHRSQKSEGEAAAASGEPST